MSQTVHVYILSKLEVSVEYIIQQYNKGHVSTPLRPCFTCLSFTLSYLNLRLREWDLGCRELVKGLDFFRWSLVLSPNVIYLLLLLSNMTNP